MKYLRMLLAASRISAATLAAMILLVTPAAGQNLLTNPGFTVDPGGWDSFGSGVLLWSTEDADGSDSSGSASLGVFSGGEGFGVSQCVAAVGGSWHRFAASINISTISRDNALRRSGRFKVIVPLGLSLRICTLSEMAIIAMEFSSGNDDFILSPRCHSSNKSATAGPTNCQRSRNIVVLSAKYILRNLCGA